ncbi:MAG: Ig-like domain-containing protein [Mediterranea sp.]|jgi:Leucine-rich repeat (LRR) protein|nr:Ig-like domain-containing protein [Mediterranea sp.]
MRKETELRTFAVALAALPVILLASCSDDKKNELPTPTPVEVEVATVTLSPAEVELELGGTVTLTPTIAPDNATDKTLEWSSSHAKVAEVDTKGMVTAKAVGTATLTATTSNGKKGTTTVRVFDPTDIPIPDAAFKAWLLDKIDHEQPDKISLEEAKAVKDIRCTEQKQIKSLEGIEFFENLKRLECWSGSQTKLDVSNLTNLTYLDCSANKSLTELTLGRLPKLKQFYCDNTALAKLDVSSLTELNYLSCKDNSLLTELTLGSLPKLEQLDCRDNALTKLDVSGLTRLYDLNCNDKSLKDVWFKNIEQKEAIKYLRINPEVTVHYYE